jgi:hypothetical protein
MESAPDNPPVVFSMPLGSGPVPQLAGQFCVVCGERIDGDYEAGYCPACHYPRHDKCVEPPKAPNPDACTACGASAMKRAQFTGQRDSPVAADLTRPLTCPVCSLVHPPGTNRCECGYSFRHEATEGRSTVRDVGLTNLLRGIAILAIGVIITAFTLVTSTATGVYVVAYGAVLAGAVMTGRGLMQLNRSRNLPRAHPEQLRRR